MIVLLLSTFSFFSPSDTVQTAPLPQLERYAGYTHHLSDSLVFFNNLTDFTDLLDQSSLSVRFKSQSPGGLSAGWVQGIAPWLQSVSINGVDFSDPVTGFADRSTFLNSGIGFLQPQALGSSLQPFPITMRLNQNWEPVPKTRINFIQGGDEYQNFEGTFSAATGPDSRVLAGFGRKATDGVFLNTANSQYQYLINYEHRLTGNHSLEFTFIGSKHEHGWSGGLDDSAVVNLNVNATDPLVSPVLDSSGRWEYTTNILQLGWHYTDTFSTVPFTHDLMVSLFDGYRDLDRASYRIGSNGSADYQFQTLALDGRLKLPSNRFNLETWYSLQRSTLTQSSFIPDPGLNWITLIGAQGQLRIMESQQLTTGGQIDLSNPDHFSAYGQLGSAIQSFQLSGGIHFNRFTRPWLWDFISGSPSNSTASTTRLYGSIDYFGDQWVSRFTGFYSTTSDAGMIKVNGRLTPSTGRTYSTLSTESHQGFSWWVLARTWHLQHEIKWTQYFDTDYLPETDIRITTGYQDRWFEESLYFYVGLTGNYQQSHPQIFPDYELAVPVVDIGNNTRSDVRLDGFLRGQINDVIFFIEWINISSEPYEDFSGFPMPASKIIVGINWWFFN